MGEDGLITLSLLVAVALGVLTIIVGFCLIRSK